MLQILLTFNSLLSESSKCIQHAPSAPIKMLILTGHTGRCAAHLPLVSDREASGGPGEQESSSSVSWVLHCIASLQMHASHLCSATAATLTFQKDRVQPTPRGDGEPRLSTCSSEREHCTQRAGSGVHGAFRAYASLQKLAGVADPGRHSAPALAGFPGKYPGLAIRVELGFVTVLGHMGSVGYSEP